jgi:hypothetical protein
MKDGVNSLHRAVEIGLFDEAAALHFDAELIEVGGLARLLRQCPNVEPVADQTFGQMTAEAAGRARYQDVGWRHARRPRT